MISKPFSKPLKLPRREERSMRVCEYLQLPSMRVHINHHADPRVHTHGHATEQKDHVDIHITNILCICALCASHTHTRPTCTHTYTCIHDQMHTCTYTFPLKFACVPTESKDLFTHTPSPAHRHVKPMHNL